MTRKEHIERARDEVYTVDMWGDGGVRLSDVIDRINTIFDDFESRTCESCKHLDTDTGKSYSYCNELTTLSIGADTAKEFYCSYWENKQ